ncbi:MAG: UvrB/UvrC motif-containing protein [Parcubacteria group bacterium]
MNSQDLAKFSLPDAPGVYFFQHASNILYIGKATSLKDRVKSYFVRDILMTRSPLIARMLEEATDIGFVETDSVLEALLLEATMIKKHQPTYNSQEKDDKSYNYVILTKENFPRVLVVRGKNIQYLDYKALKIFGPFPHAGELREALKIIRKIFPYRDKCKVGQSRPCFNAQLGLCPGVCAGWISKREYRKIMRHLILFFEARKTELIKALEKEMKALAKGHQFEEAEKIKRQIFALEHIQDIALLKHDLENRNQVESSIFRIEAYDVAHISGSDAVGVMTVVENGELNKSQYRKFKIRQDKNDDTANLREVLRRRLNHPEWRLPNLVVVDGGAGQINAAQVVLYEAGLDIAVVSVVKDERHKAREILGNNVQHSVLDKTILLANAEAHRFAIGYHRKLRGKGFRI